MDTASLKQRIGTGRETGSAAWGNATGDAPAGAGKLLLLIIAAAAAIGGAVFAYLVRGSLDQPALFWPLVALATLCACVAAMLARSVFGSGSGGSKTSTKQVSSFEAQVQHIGGEIAAESDRLLAWLESCWIGELALPNRQASDRYRNAKLWHDDFPVFIDFEPGAKARLWLFVACWIDGVSDSKSALTLNDSEPLQLLESLETTGTTVRILPGGLVLHSCSDLQQRLRQQPEDFAVLETLVDQLCQLARSLDGRPYPSPPEQMLWQR